MATLYRWWSALFFLGVVVQVSLAGYGAFYSVKKAEDNDSVAKHAVDHGWTPHAALGTILVLAALLLLVFAAIARKRLVFDPLKPTAVLFVLMALQLVLPELGRKVAALGFLHPLNALAIFGLSGWLAHRAWRASASGDTAAAAGAAPA